METNVAPFGVNAMSGAAPNTDAGLSHQRHGNWEHLEVLLFDSMQEIGTHSFLFEILKYQRSLT
jgi:hypothetical protein